MLEIEELNAKNLLLSTEIDRLNIELKNMETNISNTLVLYDSVLKERNEKEALHAEALNKNLLLEKEVIKNLYF